MSDLSTPLPRTVITVRPHGTMVVETSGEIVIQDNDGNPLPLPERKNPARISLCGCGQSRTWPVCDGSHKECGRGTDVTPVARVPVDGT